MVGIIITGHGKFASGLTAALDLIAGPQKNYCAVDFKGDTTETLAKDLDDAYASLSACNGIIVFSDLPGGSPFKTAVEVSMGKYENVHVLAGTNLPMLCEITMARAFIEDVDTLVEMAINTGKDQVVEFKMSAPKQEEATDDGI